MPQFDFVVVGAGSAGWALAARLAEEPTARVLLLEAGGRGDHLLIRMPMAWHMVSEIPRFGWNLSTEPEASTAGRSLPQPQGKLLGGASSINGTMYSRGNRGDYDRWAQMGLKGWGYEDILPYFRRSETNWRGETRFHGGSGPLSVSANPREPVVYDAMITTAKSLGFGEVEDFHGPSQEGFGMPDFAVRRGRRESSATAYLTQAAARPNLTVETHAQARNLVVDGTRIVGVNYVQNGNLRRADGGEVIVCGGAFGSPHLLLLSGIGPAEELQPLGIAPRHQLASVGRNLKDHPLVAAGFKAAAKFSFEKLLRLDRLSLSAIRWVLTGAGPLGRAPLSVQAYLRIRPDSTWSDTQLQVSHVSFQARPWVPGIRKGAGHQFTAAAMQMQPFGSGSVTLRSADPLDKPRIRLGLFKDERDKQAARHLLGFIRRFFATAPLSGLVACEFFPGAAVNDDASIDDYLSRTIQTGMHPTGTCAMATDPAASVVDAELKVHGLSGLRVCDTSVMPRIVSGNTNAPTVMIAEKAADMILGRTPLAKADILQPSEVGYPTHLNGQEKP